MQGRIDADEALRQRLIEALEGPGLDVAAQPLFELATGRILGVLPDPSHVEGAEIELASGDMLLLYTDGVTEAVAPGGEMFGEDRLRAWLTESTASSPAELLDALRDTVREWTGEDATTDDLTLVAVKRP